MAKVIRMGSAKADDPIYSSGPIVGGKRFGNSTSAMTLRTIGAPSEMELRRSGKQMEAEAKEALDNLKD